MLANLRIAMQAKRIKVLDLCPVLKLSSPQISLRLNGRMEFLPHERNRLCEYFGFREAWLFAQTAIPKSAVIEEEPKSMVMGGSEVVSVQEIGRLMEDLLHKGDQLEKLRQLLPEGSEKHAQVIIMIAHWMDLRGRLVSFIGDWDAAHSGEQN